MPVGTPANSWMKIRMFLDAATYSLKSLDAVRRRQVRLADERFIIRSMNDVNEFKAKAYAVYLSFYERTRYKTGAWRRNADGFARWADALFRDPRVVLLGGYEGYQLRGICVSIRVEDTVIYATSFCDSESLRAFLPDLLLHTVREMSANQPEISQVFAGMCIGVRGLDDFYSLRGCTLVKKPAVLHLSPLANGLLRFGIPKLYAKLLGR